MTPDEIESRTRAMSPEAAARFAVLCYVENMRFNMQGFVSIQPPDVVAEKAVDEARMLIRFFPDLDFPALLAQAEGRGEGWWEVSDTQSNLELRRAVERRATKIIERHISGCTVSFPDSLMIDIANEVLSVHGSLASERAAREAAEKELADERMAFETICDDRERLAEDNRRLREAILRYDAAGVDNTDDGLIRQSEIRRELFRLVGRKDVPHA